MTPSPATLLVLALGIAPATAEVTTARSPSAFRFDGIPSPAIDDAGAEARFVLVEGRRDPNGADLDALNDGRLPSSEDDPRSNFFFASNSDGGRLRVDLAEATDLEAIATYSWHRGGRAPQVYEIWGAMGSGDGLELSPKRGTDPAEAGWTLISKVDTRRGATGSGRQHASWTDLDGSRFQHLLFDFRATDERDPFGQTFLSEIDVMRRGGPEPQRFESVVKTFGPEDGLRFTIDATRAPELLGWSEKELIPVINEWYPKMAGMMKSDGYTPASEVFLTYKTDMGGVPAYAAGNRVSLSVPFFRSQLDGGEAIGCVIHELVHVIQDFGHARRVNRRPNPTPGWVTEGLADYVRWFLFEPEEQGARITRRNLESARHDGSYRISANFIDWVVREHDRDLLEKLNAACREGRYEAGLWKEWTGKSLEELSQDWLNGHRERLKD